MSHFSISDTKTVDTHVTSQDAMGNEIITTTSEVVKKTPEEINSEITLAFGLQDIMNKQAKKRAEEKAQAEIEAIQARIAQEAENSSVKIS